jgi:hypothetical protein
VIAASSSAAIVVAPLTAKEHTARAPLTLLERFAEIKTLAFVPVVSVTLGLVPGLPLRVAVNELLVVVPTAFVREPTLVRQIQLDPLYIVDQTQELIDPAVSRFNETYRARLRPYVINEHDTKILGSLPNNQFGLIFAYNYFNFKPMELIQQYLEELYEKLRSGGTVIMTYNDCDLAHGVALAEQHFMCYTPGSQIVKIAESTGFYVTYRHTGSGDLAWIELQRPGEIVSLRGRQTLAKVVARSK